MSEMKCADVRFVKELYPRLKPHDDVVERYRDALDQLPLVRWMPDIITAVPNDPASIVFIDAKCGQTNTDNYSVEINAHESAIAFEKLLYVPVLFVWEDGGVLSTHDIENRRFTRKDGSLTNGSGTAFYLVKRSFATKVGQRFPEIRATA